MGPVGPPGPDMLLGVGKPGPQFMGPGAGPHIGPGVLDPELPAMQRLSLSSTWMNVNFQYHLKGNVQNYPSWGRKGRVVGELPQGWRVVEGRLHDMRGTPGSPGPAGCPDHQVIFQATRLRGKA